MSFYGKLLEPMPLFIQEKEEGATKRTSNNNKNKRNDIQYLRALAIIGVLAFHLKPLWIPQGFLGVDMFFVISGYLMTAILNYGGTRSLSCSSLQTFYFRRIKRIFPTYYLIILLTLVLCSLFLKDIDYSSLKYDAIWAMTFSSNIQSMIFRENYFQRLDIYKFYLHTWSLSAEIQYYLIAPFLLYGISRSSYPLIATVVLITASWSFQTFYPYSTVTFGFVFSRLWQFLIGTIVFYFEKKSNASNFQSKRTKTNLCYALSILALFALIFIPYSIKFSFNLTVAARSITTFLTGFVMFLGTQHSFQSIYILSESLCFLGDISYSIYLVHWPIILLLKYLFIFDQIYLMGIIVVIFYLAYLQYQLFEKPLQAQSNTAAFKTVVSLIAFIIIAFIFLQGHGFGSLKMNKKAVKENEQLLKNCDRQLAELDSCKTEPHFEIPSGKPLYTYLCSFKGTGNATILLAGNSFAMRQYENIIKVSSHKFKKMYLVAQAGCTIFTSHNDAKWECDFVVNRLKEFMTILKPDLMIVSQRLSHENLFNMPLNSFEEAKNDSVTKILKEYWKEYSELTKKIIIVEPHATFYDSPKEILNENFGRLLDMNISLSKYFISQMDYNAEVNPGWWRIFASIEECPKCSTIPIRQYFCHPDTQECDIYDHEKLLTLYCDRGHLNTHGVERYILDLADAIDNAI